MTIKDELDTEGEYIDVYRSEGYYCWMLIFEKKDGVYSVTDHRSTESGYEDDLDYFESENFDEVIKYVKESYGYEIY